MRSFAWTLLLLSSLLLTSGREPERHVIEVSNAGELMELFATPLNDVTVRLSPGRYELAPQSIKLGLTPSTVGLRITGQNVHLTGPQHGLAEIAANATVSVYFDGCRNCEVERIAVTSPTSTVPDSAGTAILARNSAVRISNCVVGLTSQGIVGTAGSALDIEFNEISGSLAGISIFGNADAVVKNNLVAEGPSSAVAVGCLITRGASVVLERNHIRGFNFGILLMKEASIELRANIIEGSRTDGIASSLEGLGRVRIEKNAFYRCGGSGIAIQADGDQRAWGNFIVETGRLAPNASAILVRGARADAAVRKNTLYGNTVTDESLDRDVPREIFWRERRSWTRTYRNTPVGVDGRHKFHESAFLERYGRWLH